MKLYVLAACLIASALSAATIYVPNASFEFPETPFADQRIDSWQDNPKPAWYDESGGFLWDQLTGVFKNPGPTEAGHIDNMDGNQAIFLFAVPEVGIFQDYNSLDWWHPTPTHDFNAKFQVGKSYRLTVGIIGGGGNMLEGASLAISLYYRDAASNVVTVASTNIVHTNALFPTNTHFVDIALNVPTVKSGDAWAGQNIGIAMNSIVLPQQAGGYWDIDHVRLVESVHVPNGSFESPDTPFADPRADSWQDNPKPDWYDESGGFLWDQLTGVFENTIPTDPSHIDNVDGTQAMFLFALPQVGIFQDYNSTDWAHPSPTHDFDVKYQPGKSYHLTVGVVGGGGGMREGVSLGLGLYYRDASSNMVIVALTNVAHTVALFSNTTHFVDIPLRIPLIKATDPAAGQNIGIAIFSTVAPDLAGGYWDIDHVRLVETQAPRLSIRSPGELTLQSEPGLKFEILASSNVAAPLATWTVLGAVTNTTGTVAFTDNSTTKPQRSYVARQIP